MFELSARRWPLIPALALALGPVAAAPPITAFTNFPKYETLQISPRGTYLAMTRRLEEFENIRVVRYPALSLSTSSHLGKQTDVGRLLWASDTRMLIQPERRFSGLTAYKAPTGEIIGLDVDGRNAKLLFGYQAGVGRTASRVDSRETVYAAGELLARLPQDPDHVLIQTRSFGVEGLGNMVYRMHVQNGQLTRVAAGPVANARFLADRNGRVTLAYGSEDSGQYKVFRWDAGGNAWQLLDQMSVLGGTVLPLSTTGANDVYHALDDASSPVQGVVAWNVASGERRTLFRHAGSDAFPLATDPAGFTWLYGYSDHFPEYWYPDAQHPLAVLHRSMRTQFPDANIEFTSQTDDMAMVVARISSPLQPNLFMLVDVKARKAVHTLESRPDLQARDLAPVEPFELKARDGVGIRGYLTTPRAGDRRRLPMVVLVHGGPHGPFDSYDFDWEAQLLASRGFAVLQVNFRGSGGRGRAFEALGYGRWGAEMQDDVTDATRWAIADGVADPRRICIMGSSYGAFSALSGVAREPALYRCAVGIAGVYDLPLMHEKGDIPGSSNGRRYLRMAVGTDSADMAARSPTTHAARITAPVLLVHGRDDERAPLAQAVRMRDALTAAGREPEWETLRLEGHGFFNEANRERVYARVLDFLARHTAPP